MTRAEEIARNLQAVRARIKAAEETARRPPGAVKLVAVSKRMSLEDVRFALDAGQRDFGESYAQELRDKRAALEGFDVAQAPSWHFVGPLQSNKIKLVAGQVALIHSVDRGELLDEIANRVGALPEAAMTVQECLVQVNLAAEAGKRGVSVTELSGLLDRFAALKSARCVGLMLIPPLQVNPESNRPLFATLRRLAAEEASRQRPNVVLRELSMGMSQDLESAIAEGATMVRIGTAIFGERSRK